MYVTNMSRKQKSEVIVQLDNNDDIVISIPTDLSHVRDDYAENIYRSLEERAKNKLKERNNYTIRETGSKRDALALLEREEGIEFLDKSLRKNPLRVRGSTITGISLHN